MYLNQLRISGRPRFFGYLALSLMFAGVALAVENRPLPSFEVQNLDGSVVNTSTWAMEGKWVLIYLEGQCGPCTHLLARLTKEQYPQLASRTIIIVAGSQPSDVKMLQKGFTDLAQASWYADPTRNAPKTLNLHGAPVTLGIQDKTIRWGISGIPPAPGLLPAVLKKWSAQ